MFEDIIGNDNDNLINITINDLSTYLQGWKYEMIDADVINKIRENMKSYLNAYGYTENDISMELDSVKLLITVKLDRNDHNTYVFSIKKR